MLYFFYLFFVAILDSTIKILIQEQSNVNLLNKRNAGIVFELQNPPPDMDAIATYIEILHVLAKGKVSYCLLHFSIAPSAVVRPSYASRRNRITYDLHSFVTNLP